MERREVGVREWEWARGDGVGEKKASGLKVAVLEGVVVGWWKFVGVWERREMVE